MKRKADDVSPENGEEGWREELPPSPEDFYARPIGKRRELTDNDRKRNQGVDKLFEVMIPGLPIDTDPSETRTSEQQIAQSIEKLLKRLDLGVSPWIGELTEAWTKILPPEVTVHRLTGDPPKRLLIFPKWTADKKKTMNYIRNALTIREAQR